MPLRRRTPTTPTTGRSEVATRSTLIDPALKVSGWDVANPSQVGLEIPVDGSDPAAVQAVLAQLRHIKDAAQLYLAPLPRGMSDYVLYQPNGEIIAVVEAKKTSIDPRLAQAQAEFYVAEIAKRQSFTPFAFMTNGEEIYFLDAGAAHKRPVPGFFSPEDLERLLYLRQHRQPLTQTPITMSIADRPYQHEAIRRAQQREALRQAEHLFQSLQYKAFRGELGAGAARAVEALAAAPDGAAEAGALAQARLALE